MKIEEARVFIVGPDGMIADMYQRRGIPIVNDIKDATVVQFTGGSDVTPRYYGHSIHPTTGYHQPRDEREVEVFRSINLGYQMIVGICRGAQFLCVMNGGALFQDVDKHAISGTHKIMYYSEEGIIEESQVTSTHHQMMFPGLQKPIKEKVFERPWELWGGCNLTTYRDFGGDRRAKTNPEHGPDYEIIYWPETGSLAFQGHPEYHSKECQDLFFRCFTRAFANTLPGHLKEQAA